MKKIILAVAVAAVASMAVISTAAAGVERYQTQTMTITAKQPYGAVGQWDNVWTHTYTVELNPCDGSFAGVGTLAGVNPSESATETISGRLDGAAVSFTATRNSDGLVYSLSNAALNNGTVTLATTNPAVSWVVEFKVDATKPVATSSFKNHGEYVSSVGGGADAAHSCIGMPIR